MVSIICSVASPLWAGVDLGITVVMCDVYIHCFMSDLVQVNMAMFVLYSYATGRTGRFIIRVYAALAIRGILGGAVVSS